jgi:hypothetical protein
MAAPASGSARRITPLILLFFAAALLKPDAPPDRVLTWLVARFVGRDLSSVGSALGLLMGAAGLLSSLALALLIGFAVADAIKRRKSINLAAILRSRERSLFTGLLALALMGLLFYGMERGAIRLSDARAETSGQAAAADIAAESTGEEAREDAVELERDRRPPAWLALGALVAAGLVAASAARIALQRLAERRAAERSGAAGEQDEAAEGDAAELACGLARARERLRLGDRDRDAILDCYDEMCSFFSDASTPESATEALTPREFAGLLKARGAPAAEVGELTALFELARYSELPCGPAERESAANALRRIESAFAGAER